MRTICLFLFLLVFFQGPGGPVWKTADPDYPWSFPADHWAHDGYKTEWWYFTGHLESPETSRRFGFQFTFFRILLGPERPGWASAWNTHGLIMGHAAVSELDAGRHWFSEVLYREMPLLGGFGVPPDRRIAWSQAPPGTEGTWELRWNGEAFDFAMRDQAQGLAFALSTIPSKPLVFQGPKGFSRKGSQPGAASLYYSFPRLRTTGTLTVGENTFPVQGESWMDKEFGSNQLAEEQVGWDWFSLQLQDGRELMLYHLRKADGTTDYARGTLVGPQGAVRHLEAGSWKVEILDRWQSPATGAGYPARWRIRLPEEDLDLEVRPLLADQENRSRILQDLYYWEGAVEVRDATGGPVGRGFVELTGYGTNNRPPV